MRARRCQGCGAPLPESPHPQLGCGFCGLVHDSSGAAAFAPPSTPGGQANGRTLSRGVMLALVGGALLIVGGTVVPGMVAAYLGWKASRVALTSVGAVPAALQTATAATPASLRTLPPGYHELDASPPAGGYSAVDPVAAVPWALALAQAWSDDARLTRIDVTRLHPDGTVNVQDDDEARLRYRFVSPSRMAALQEAAQLSQRVELPAEFWVSVEGTGRPRVFVDRGRVSSLRKEPAPPHPTVMPLPDLLARQAVRSMLAPVPFYNGYMTYLTREGWVWYLSTLANESMPRVRASDGVPWPYRRQAPATR